MPPEKFEYWIDANLPRQLALWLKEKFSVNAFHLNDLGLLHASDKEIYLKASDKPVVILTKDEDFADLMRSGSAFPKVIWVTVGNISNQQLKKIIIDNFEEALLKLVNENNLVEITTSI